MLERERPGSRAAPGCDGTPTAGSLRRKRSSVQCAPVSAHPTRPLVVARAVRAFADGFASVLLARYLKHLGFSGLRIGVIVAATLLGSAALTLIAGLRLARFGTRSVLLWSCGLMSLTGVGSAA